MKDNCPRLPNMGLVFHIVAGADAVERRWSQPSMTMFVSHVQRREAAVGQHVDIGTPLLKDMRRDGRSTACR
jgi:hypothetical protein